jgi:hypothetical protein
MTDQEILWLLGGAAAIAALFLAVAIFGVLFAIFARWRGR